VHDATHPPRTSCAKNIELIWHLRDVVTNRRQLWRDFCGVEPPAGLSGRRNYSSIIGGLCIIN
jgi:hypothetical protein